METMKFNADFLPGIPVEITENGKVTNYILQEMSGISRGKYNDCVAENSEEYTTSEGKQTAKITNFSAVHGVLLHLSLFEASSGKNVPLEKVSNWPSRVSSPLLQKAREISHLDEEARDRSKNDSEERDSSGSN